MSKLYLLVIVLVVFIAAPSFTAAVENDVYTRTLQVFKDSPAVQEFFNSSYGYAVFPIIGKAGWIVGGSYGKGLVYRNEDITGKVSVFEGSIGFQFGGKAFSEIIFFEDKRAFDEFTRGEFGFDASIQAIIITAGAGAQTGTAGNSASATAGPKTGAQMRTRYFNGMAVFVHSKGGLMVEASVSGQQFIYTPFN